MNYDEISAIRNTSNAPATSIPDSGYHGSSTCSQSEIASRSPTRPIPKHRRITRSRAKRFGDDDITPPASLGSQIGRAPWPDRTPPLHQFLADLRGLEHLYPDKLAPSSSSTLPMLLDRHLPLQEDSDQNENSMTPSKLGHDSLLASSADEATAENSMVPGTDQDESGEHGSCERMPAVHHFLSYQTEVPWNPLHCGESQQGSPSDFGSDSGEGWSMAGSELSSSTTSTVSYIGATLTAYQRQVVESLMGEFKALFCQELGNSAAGMGQVAGLNSATSPGNPQQSPQRGHGNGSNEAPEDGDPSKMPSSGGGNNGPRSRNDEPFPVRKFACPYYKREPWKHTNRRACAGPGWLEFHRIK